MPRLCEFYPGICLTTDEKVRKNLIQGKKNLSQSTVYKLSKHPHITKHTHTHTHTHTCTHTHIHMHTHTHTHAHTRARAHTHMRALRERNQRSLVATHGPILFWKLLDSLMVSFRVLFLRNSHYYIFRGQLARTILWSLWPTGLFYNFPRTPHHISENL